MLILKLGGGAQIDLQKFCEDLAVLARKKKIILVHGGNFEFDQIAEKLGHKSRHVKNVDGQSSRYTDRKTLEILEMVYCGKINKAIVENLQKIGVNAVGLSAMDGRIAEGVRQAKLRITENGKQKILHGDCTGSLKKINRKLLDLLLENNFLPVLTPPAFADDGSAINVDGDKLASLIAQEFQAEKLIFFSETPGLLKDLKDEKSLIVKIPKNEIDNFAEFAQARMKKKILSAKRALENSVKEIIFADGRVDQPITKALAGEGTHIW